MSIFYENLSTASLTNALLWVGTALALIVLLAALYAQIYRYRKVSTRLERQQTKWVIFGLSLWFLFMLISSYPYMLIESLPPGSQLPWWATYMVDLEDVLTQMGEFLLLMAEQRAAEQGVNTETTCRKGRVRETIKRAAIEVDSTLVILGRPSWEESKYSMADLEAFAAEVEAETGAKTKIV
jgi:hypothetical protein